MSKLILIMVKFLLLFLGFVFADWHEPMKIIDEYDGKQSIFTDTSNGITHVLTNKIYNTTFLYQRLYPDGTLSNSVRLFPKRLDSANYAITGMNDGKTLYIVYQDYRIRSDKISQSDIYFSESKNGGLNWTKPLCISYADDDDIISREDPKVLVTGGNRVWIFYKIKNSPKASYGYVTKPYESWLFMKEKTFSLSYGIDQAWIVYAIHDEFPTILIYFEKKFDTKLYRFSSQTNGIIWTDPEEATGYCENGYIDTHPFTSLSSMSHIYVICRDGNYKLNLRKSSNLGIEWQNIKLPSNDYINNFSFSNDIMGYSYIDVYFKHFGESKFNKIEGPFIDRKIASAELTITQNHVIWVWYHKTLDIDTTDLWVTWRTI